LRDLRLDELPISAYNKRYLGEKIRNLSSVLNVYGHLLQLATKDWDKTLQEFTLVDYGGGSGVLSFLAKESGIGTVIYCDIYDVSCKDARTLSQMLGINLDHVVCGDVDELVSYLFGNNICIHAVVSYDVLEHIYDLKYHFQRLATLQGEFCVVYGSGANIRNPYVRRRLQRIHFEAEYCQRKRKWGHKERDTLRPYLEIRQEIIAQLAPDLPQETIHFLAQATRGLRKDDMKYTWLSSEKRVRFLTSPIPQPIPVTRIQATGRNV